MKPNADELKRPIVSIAIGWNTNESGRPSYFLILRSAACSAADLPNPDWFEMYGAAQVCIIVASQARYFPRSQGISVVPSGLLPSSLKSPAGSLVLGTSALVSARQIMSLITWCLSDRP